MELITCESDIYAVHSQSTITTSARICADSPH